MTTTFAADCVVLDIEGTTSATRFVTDVLYPYSRERFLNLLRQRAADPPVQRALAQIRDLLSEPHADLARIEQTLNTWLDNDSKVTPLKTLQGIVWAEGFARGELVSHFYPDVVPAVRAWRAAGVRLCIYSSGSTAAQRAWFAHSPEGDLTALLDALFDTENAGPKQSPHSYQAIASAIGVKPHRLLFLSDRSAELDAARDAGWLTAGVRRTGEPYYNQGVGAHPEVSAFTEISIVPTGSSA
ncbi:enolase-phosphatase E1 [Streptomyces sp. V4I8]|uniref:acireductone synthase n=1 Tax=Streptomyces sp. V4I8 TaxID=3156469 RepID=UPI003513C2A9